MSLTPLGPTGPQPQPPDPRLVRVLLAVIAILGSMVAGLVSGIFAFGVGGKSFYVSVGTGAGVCALALPLILAVLDRFFDRP